MRKVVEKKAPERARPIEEVLASLQVRSAALNDIDSGISAAICTIEKVLLCACTVRIQIELPDRCEQLAWGKLDGAWCLMITDGARSVRLLSCSRERRAAMFQDGHIDSLVRGGVAQVNDVIKDRELAISEAERIAHELAQGSRTALETGSE